eukprot:COSAG01_NODE_3197_length_6430_cov_36.427263_8_plen_75_part_00
MLYSKSIHKKYDNQWMECFPCFALMGCANTTEFFAFEEFHTESAESAISIETPRPASVCVTPRVHAWRNRAIDA